ncbi:lamin tail domain-containing protein [Lysobacter sp. K5869]|uniref:lamin tail domain-containing protein n=1 Tax=Lysobacter sp. K5869 TaxID=2820808 RepID=UPI001C061988|nr:lamin tail domain-containing protein [Lysobacter sp. K5869]QWP78486.1 lamin tail domain-containing protein [Lysobacter sp. K5869]
MNKSGSRLLAAALAFAAAGTAQAGVVISQIYGAGGNAGSNYTHDFIELHNNGDTAVSLDGWSVQYNLGPSPATWQRTALSGSIAPGGYYLIQQASGGAFGLSPLPTPDATGTIAMQASGGKVLLVDHNRALSGACPALRIDAVGISTSATCSETRPLAGTTATTTAALRKDAGCNDTNDNNADFAILAPAPRNSAAPVYVCGGAPAQLYAQDTEVEEGQSGQNLATVRIFLDRPAGAAGVGFDYATRNGSATAGIDYAASSGHLSIPAGQSEITVSVPVFGDEEPESDETFFVDVSGLSGAVGADLSAQVTIRNSARPITPISQVQGAGAYSPLNGMPVDVVGIVTALTGEGFFIQSDPSRDDGDPATSEGLFVRTSALPAAARIGNLVRVSSTVVEGRSAFLTPGRTQLNDGWATILIATGRPLPAPAIDDAAVLSGQLERYEGMRLRIGELNALVQADGRLDEDRATATGSGLVYAQSPTLPAPALRNAGLRRYVMPPPNTVPLADPHASVIALDPQALDPSLPLYVHSGARLSELSGVVDYRDGRYVLVLDSPLTPGYAPLQMQGTRSPQASAQTDSVDGDAVSIATYPELRLFDTQNDPYAAEPLPDQTVYDRRIAKVALGVREFLRLPDVIGFTDVENLATLQTLAARVNADAVAAGQSDPLYVAHLLEGNDPLGLDVGYLVKTAPVAPGKPRIEVLQVAQIGKDTQWVDGRQQTSLLNDRPPLALDAVAHYADGRDFPFSAVLVSQQSELGIEDGSVYNDVTRLKRQRQAEFLAGYLHQRQTLDPTARLIAFGDFNAPQFNDGYADVIGTVAGAPSADEATLVPGDGLDAVDPNLIVLTDLGAAAQRYSSYRDGIAHQLEHLLVNEAMVGATAAIEFDHARINAGFPESYRTQADSAVRASNRDPSVAYLLPPPRADLRLSATAQAATVRVGETYAFAIVADNLGPGRALSTGLGFAVDVEAPSLSVATDAIGWTCDAPQVATGRTSVACSAAAMTADASARFTVSALAGDELAGRDLTLSVAADTASQDPDAANDRAEAQVSVTPQP